ncbi:epilepsy holoprosencephaly candidate 1/tmem1 [Holotrichia oblita]|uniref:Epilepsy holoprosencephaly candidate 1/tmem1 n=1 Tax=Holotrichia oblita TaxID=644536 RepID=A0ACB9TL51_HOLOL|nr:epilepsy holoprosencephaly candidate 1/tmem1 [Holotrichia oblita]
MNGTEIFENDLFIDRRPIITCAGELEVFSLLEDNLSLALPQDSCEWRRSLGRPVRSVHIGANFAPFSPNALPKPNQWDLIRQPLFHIYWTECVDVDIYKTGIKDEIELWLKELTAREIPDWLIVVVENYDGKRANKLLPRTTVLDKIRADFAPKQGDRCISVINPGKVESRSADSWRGLVSRVRHLVLVSYARAVARLEDHVRQQRERRNELGWNFLQYFNLQEELAQVLEMLGLYDEALVQYDELDALFSQFVINGHTGDAVNWLINFQKPLEIWHGLKLGPSHLPDDPSILELRAYIFAKQAHMLLLINKIWEIASRCLPFLHNCTREITLLEVTAPPGAISCWLFLACMEVLQTCEKFNQADQVEAYSLNTAPLWAYASQKLKELGELCGLMPNGSPSSEQLHIVVGLSAGMGDNPGSLGAPSPTDKLKKALCSQEAFNKNYLELAELAMGTYKHIGRLRSARLIGRDLAFFYLLLGETQKAAAFLGDALKTFEQDNWRELAAQTQVDLAECYMKSNDTRKFIRTCAAIASSPYIDTLIRWSYFDDMLKCLDLLEKPLLVPFKDIIKVVSINVKNNGPIMQDSVMDVEVGLDSNFPREILCTDVLLSIEQDKEVKKVKDKNSRNVGKETKPKDNSMQRLKIQRHLDYKQDKQLASSSVVCKTTPLKRTDSSASPPQSDFNYCLKCAKLPLMLTPGLNVIRLSRKASDTGKFLLGQIAVKVRGLELISSSITPKATIEVKREEPTVRLDKGMSPLLLGLEQRMELTVTIGSYKIEPNSTVKLITSRGLYIQHLEDVPLQNSIDIAIQQIEPFSKMVTPIRILADIFSQDQQVTISWAWSTKPIPVHLSFTPPLTSSVRLHTVKHRKFVQVTLTGKCDMVLNVDLPKLNFGEDVKVVDYNVPSSQIITNDVSISYLWEIQFTPQVEPPPLKGEYKVEYTTQSNKLEDCETRTFQHFFDITDYQTLYHVEAHVEPTKGNEFCRVGAVCQLHLTIKPGSHTLQMNTTNSLMYEVLAEQSLWAVCGRTAGVVSFIPDPEPQTVVMDVMPLNSGYLPLPAVRLSKYIPAEYNVSDKIMKPETHPRLEPFSPGQVYNSSKGQQVHVIAALNDVHMP